MKQTNVIRGLAVMAAMAICATPQARADLVFDLAGGNPAISGYPPGPNGYGTVDIAYDSGTEITVTLTAHATAAYQFAFGDGGIVALNLTGSGFGASTFSGTQVGGGAIGTYALGNPSGSEDGFGKFTFSLDSNSGANPVTTLTFHVTQSASSGVTWASDLSNLLTPNSGSGQEVAGHIFVYDVNNIAAGALATGYAAVPEPTTVIAGALLLLPLGASTIRVMRRGNRCA